MKNLLAGLIIVLPAVTYSIAPDNPLSPSEWPGVGRIYWPNTNSYASVVGGGIVISTRHVLTAYHSSIPPNTANKWFELDSNPGTFLPWVAIHECSHWFPSWWPYEPNPSETNPFFRDIAIIEFAPNTFPQSIVSPIFEGDDEIGREIAIVGVGHTATQHSGNPGWWIQSSTWGVRREGRNVISTFEVPSNPWDTTYSFDWDGYGVLPGDDELSLLDTFEDGGPIEGEATIYPYDSGGPSLTYDDGIWKVIGIHFTRGQSPFYPNSGYENSSYGTTGADMRVSFFKEWILGVIAL